MNIVTDQTEDVLIIPEIKSSLCYLQETFVNVQLLTAKLALSSILHVLDSYTLIPSLISTENEAYSKTCVKRLL